jgi:hypothetical protein
MVGVTKPSVIPDIGYRGSIRNEDQKDARLKMSGMTNFLHWG